MSRHWRRRRRNPSSESTGLIVVGIAAVIGFLWWRNSSAGRVPATGATASGGTFPVQTGAGLTGSTGVTSGGTGVTSLIRSAIGAPGATSALATVGMTSALAAGSTALTVPLGSS